MSKNQTAVGEAVCKLLDKHPDWPARTLARTLCVQNPECFANIEQARNAVRRYLGQQGKTSRSGKFARPAREPGQGWDAVIPPSIQQLPGWGEYKVRGPCEVLVLADTHIPYHDEEALALALEYGAKRKPTHILLNGDTQDHYDASDFCKNPKLRDYPAELKAGRYFRRGLRKRFGKKVKIIEKLGNHDERYDRHMRVHSSMLIGIEDFDYENVFGLRANDITLVRDKRPIMCGKLNVLHGHEFGGFQSNPVNFARTLFLKAGAHCIAGHNHITSQHSEKNLNGKVIATFSTGCLCNLTPEYRPINKWNLGFAWISVDSQDAFRVDNLKIIQGAIW